MNKQITVREAIAETDAAFFWQQLHTYFARDMFPDPEDEDRAYFLGDEYSAQMQRIRDRAQDSCFYLFFCRDGQDIGFALPVIYTTEDGKCFIMEFCVYPEHRGGGMGKACAKALLEWAGEHGALYAELNCGNDARRRRFWESVGFRRNGYDEWGEPLMLLPPAEDMPVTVTVLENPEDWQLLKLENGFLEEIGEQMLSEEKQKQLIQAVKDKRIMFFAARRGSRAVGMCSVTRYFSTFACADTGVFEDFYIEPVFRKKGIARKLAHAAQHWCRENGVASLTVCCAKSDEGMYRSLGFEVQLGSTFAYII